MAISDFFSVEEFKKGLLFRILILGFMGIGWDVCMTFLQQIISGKVNHNALCPSSVWMFLAYGTLPFFFYPLVSVSVHFRLPYPARLLVLLAVFYSFELGFGTILRSFGIIPWNYDWYLSPAWTLHGIITWHPAILVAWIIFLILVEWIDTVLRNSYPVIRENLASFWKNI